uniref:Ig-like domain-containing protein n=1 Tax=Neogobius melanostomus TaxID=47308 RepID=A0A8C6S624_9GOBI
MTLRYGSVHSDRPYSCYARHPLQSQTKTCKITMDPVSKPEVVVNDAYPLEGSTVTMHCNLQSGTEPIQFLWQYKALSGNTSTFAQNTSEITLTVQRRDTGWYRCLVKNLVNSVQSDQTLLNITYGPEFPEIVVTPLAVAERGHVALEQETVSLFCKAKSNPPSQYKWFYNNSQVNTGPQFTLTDILRTQTGDYTCLAQNSFLNTRSKKSISLTVYYPPDGLPSCSVESTFEHTYLRLFCTWPGGFPTPTLFWSGDLVDQEAVNPKTNTAILQYSQGTASNNSQFRCQGSHIALNQPTGCQVKPYSPAGEPQCSAYVTSNTQTLMLSCSWDGGHPKALVWWRVQASRAKVDRRHPTS